MDIKRFENVEDDSPKIAGAKAEHIEFNGQVRFTDEELYDAWRGSFHGNLFEINPDTIRMGTTGIIHELSINNTGLVANPKLAKIIDHFGDRVSLKLTSNRVCLIIDIGSDSLTATEHEMFNQLGYKTSIPNDPNVPFILKNASKITLGLGSSKILKQYSERFQEFYSLIKIKERGERVWQTLELIPIIQTSEENSFINFILGCLPLNEGAQIRIVNSFFEFKNGKIHPL
ncbi:MAG: hypothetical protein ABIE74_07525 [Pseudomonadota bacterium]